MPDSDRFAKLIAKLTRGSLPKSSGERAEVLPGNGDPCSGCAEPIDRHEECHVVTVRNVVTMRFHADCYAAWVTYR